MNADPSVCRLQELDPRNFHAWRYRRVITARAGIPPEQEERYTMSLINANFSDYSAWHARTVLLPQIHAADCGPLKEQGSAQQGEPALCTDYAAAGCAPWRDACSKVTQAHIAKADSQPQA